MCLNLKREKGEEERGVLLSVWMGSRDVKTDHIYRKEMEKGVGDRRGKTLTEEGNAATV